VEDGITLGICLCGAGKDNVWLAIRLSQRTRYEHARRVAETRGSTRVRWHIADWDAVKKDLARVQLPREDWIMKHNSHQFAEVDFNRVAEEIRNGRTLKDFDDPGCLKKSTKEGVDAFGAAA